MKETKTKIEGIEGGQKPIVEEGWSNENLRVKSTAAGDGERGSSCEVERQALTAAKKLGRA